MSDTVWMSLAQLELLTIVGYVVVGVVCLAAGFLVYRAISSRKTQAAARQAESLVAEAKSQAEAVRKQAPESGKVVLMPNAARFDDCGQTVDWFGPSLAQQNITVKFYRDYVGWEKDSLFPFDASVLLLERLDAMQTPDILKWAGTAPALTFIDPPTPPNLYDMGSCREAEVTNSFYWRDHVSVYPLARPDGKRIFVLVRRGRETDGLKDLLIAWPDTKPVTLFLPPDVLGVQWKPIDGKLTLPEWRDVAIMVC